MKPACGCKRAVTGDRTSWTATGDRIYGAVTDDRTYGTGACMAEGRKGLEKENPALEPDLHGRCWTRTSDPYDVSVVLCQLS